ncbi:MAG: CBS domain-containing protein [Deltaproteobacteria bacterium]|nr:CBS domain-containing protein [Deltaproteobacteria bacterium]
MESRLDLSATVADIVAVSGPRRLSTVAPGAAVPAIIKAFAGAEHARLVYVVSADQQLIGVISLGNLVQHLLFHHSGKAVDNLHLISMATSETALDFIDRPVITARLDETVEVVLERMLAADIKEIPVLNEAAQVVADLTLVDIMHRCTRDILS